MAEYSDDTQLKDIPGISEPQLKKLTEDEELLTVGDIRRLPVSVWQALIQRLSIRTLNILFGIRPKGGIFYLRI